jgi:hypothetical protein
LTADVLSEGLDIQSADCIVNYDLPYNPQRIEQRIGRVDRIGQDSDHITVINLLVSGSTDERVYDLLHSRIGIFEDFVGDALPILEEFDVETLEPDSPELWKMVQEAENIRKLQELESLNGLEDFLDEDTRHMVQDRKRDLSQLRLLVIRDYLQILLGSGANLEYDKSGEELRVSGLTESDADIVAKQLPMEVADSIKSRLTTMIRRNRPITISTNPEEGDWYIPLMHPLMSVAASAVFQHLYGTRQEMPVEIIQLRRPIDGLVDTDQQLVVTEHTLESSFSRQTVWKWWKVGRDGHSVVETSPPEGLSILATMSSAKGTPELGDVESRLVTKVIHGTFQDKHESLFANFVKTELSRATWDLDGKVRRLRAVVSRIKANTGYGSGQDEDRDDVHLKMLEADIENMEKQLRTMKSNPEAILDFRASWRLAGIAILGENL